MNSASQAAGRFRVVPVPAMGAEDVVVATTGPHEGSIYTGTEDGGIFRISHDTRSIDLVARTSGRPLGLELDPDGRLLVCDARLGLLWVDPQSGGIEHVLDSIEGTPMRFCNNAAIGTDGTIFFSDSSRLYGIEEWKKDFVEHTRTGRLMRRDADGTVTTLLDGLAFANGVALSAAEDYVAVAETGARTVRRVWVSGDRAGTQDLLCSDLPGYPDNIARGSDGLIWVTIASPVNALVERLHTAPVRLRTLVTKIPEALQPKPAQTVRAQAFDDQGRRVHDLDITPADHGTAFHMVTGVREHDGTVWLGSLHEPSIASWRL